MAGPVVMSVEPLGINLPRSVLCPFSKNGALDWSAADPAFCKMAPSTENCSGALANVAITCPFENVLGLLQSWAGD